jgi:hypothetical protein
MKSERQALRIHGTFSCMIERSRHLRQLERLLRQFPAVAILGARQVGKTTLARQLVARRRAPVTIFDLENAEAAPRPIFSARLRKAWPAGSRITNWTGLRSRRSVRPTGPASGGGGGSRALSSPAPSLKASGGAGS